MDKKVLCGMLRVLAVAGVASPTFIIPPPAKCPINTRHHVDNNSLSISALDNKQLLLRRGITQLCANLFVKFPFYIIKLPQGIL